MENPSPSRLVAGEKLDNCLFYIDAKGVVAYVNEYCCNDLGYAREELIAHTVTELEVLTDSPGFMCMLRQRMGGKSSRFETIVRRKDGSTFPAEICITYAPYGNRMLLRCDLCDVVCQQ